MSIKVVCPNGHVLQVKSEFAGKSGLCPHSKARIVVPLPEPHAVSEDEWLEVVGPPRWLHVLRSPTGRRPSIQSRSAKGN